MFVLLLFVFFFKQKTAYEMRISDWSSDVCSSDLSSPRWDSPSPWQHSCPCSAAISASFFRSATSIVRCSRYSASTGDEEPLQTMWNRRAADRTGAAAPAAPPFEAYQVGWGITLTLGRLLPFDCHPPATAQGAP